MKLEEITAKLNTIKAGTIQHFVYASEKECLDGSKLIKRTSVPSRLKINYTNTKDYVPPVKAIVNVWNSIYTNAVKQSVKNGTIVLAIFPRWKQSKTEYFTADGQPIEKSVAKQMLKPEKPNGKEPPRYMTVGIEKVVELGKQN